MASQMQPTQATQASTPSTPALPAKKAFIRTIRTLPKLTKVWLQGVVVWIYAGGIAVDDGTGIARVAFVRYDRLDLASPVDTLTLGMYVMVIGEVRQKLVKMRVGIRALTVRNLTPQGPLMDSLWALEVADAYLAHAEREREVVELV